MPYRTPQELPEADDCRPLFIPADSEWLALFGGALTELLKTWNWEYSGGLTVDETIDKMTDIINNWYSDPCATCEAPGGYRIIRIGTGGHLEQIGEDGEWEPTTDDYYIPPPDARTGGTSEDQICLAAKNAVNVLEQLYENWTESWDSELSLDEAILAFIAFLISLVPFGFAPIVGAIAIFLLPIFAAFYAALSYLTADLWDADFSNQMICFLQECANNDAGVVTFDYDCFVGKLNSLADGFGLTEVQVRLYLQVSYLIYFIGGIDGLNLAASTTDITNDDCSFCACEGTAINFGISDHGFSLHGWESYQGVGSYGSGKWNFDYYPPYPALVSNQLGIAGDVDVVCGTGLNVNMVLTGGAPTSPTMQIRVTTVSQVKNATFTPINGTQDVLWDEGGYLDEDSAYVEIGYIGAAGYGVGIVSFQTGDL